MTAAAYRYVTDKSLPPTIGFGPGIRVLLGETEQLLGFVRRISPHMPGRASWMVYYPDGSEAGIADQRQGAAIFLHEAQRSTPA